MSLVPITEDRVARLRDFGLSEYAARAYLALLDLGLTEARDVSSLSRVPTSKIYHILDQLHEKGLAHILPEFPKKYAPVPFEEYLDKIQREHAAAAKRIEDEREDLTALFSVVGSVEAGDRGGFTVIRGRRNVIGKTIELLGSAEKEVLVVGSRGTPLRMEPMLDELKRAAKRSVRMRYLVPVEPENAEALAPLAALADVRAREIDESAPSGNVSISVFDNARALIVHYVPDDGHLYQGSDTAIYTDHEGMVAAMRALVEPQWKGAVPFETARERLASGRLAEFTRFHARSEDVVAAIASAVDAGASELRVSIPVPADEPQGLDRALAESLAKAGMRTLALIDVVDVDTAKALSRAAAADRGVEIRHLESGMLSRFWLLDDREAFFSVTRPRVGDAASDLVVHTNNAATLLSLRLRFDELWAGAQPLAERAAALEGRAHAAPRKVP